MRAEFCLLPTREEGVSGGGPARQGGGAGLGDAQGLPGAQGGHSRVSEETGRQGPRGPGVEWELHLSEVRPSEGLRRERVDCVSWSRLWPWVEDGWGQA